MSGRRSPSSRARRRRRFTLCAYRLIKSCDRYVKYVPEEKAKKLVAVKFKAAKIYYDHNHFVEALNRFEAIVTAPPPAPKNRSTPPTSSLTSTISVRSGRSSTTLQLVIWVWRRWSKGARSWLGISVVLPSTASSS